MFAAGSATQERTLSTARHPPSGLDASLSLACVFSSLSLDRPPCPQPVGFFCPTSPSALAPFFFMPHPLKAIFSAAEARVVSTGGVRDRGGRDRGGGDGCATVLVHRHRPRSTACLCGASGARSAADDIVTVVVAAVDTKVGRSVAAETLFMYGKRTNAKHEHEVREYEDSSQQRRSLAGSARKQAIRSIPSSKRLTIPSDRQCPTRALDDATRGWCRNGTRIICRNGPGSSPELHM